jgi:hypothetical protein
MDVLPKLAFSPFPYYYNFQNYNHPHGYIPQSHFLKYGSFIGEDPLHRLDERSLEKTPKIDGVSYIYQNKGNESAFVLEN